MLREIFIIPKVNYSSALFRACYVTVMTIYSTSPYKDQPISKPISPVLSLSISPVLSKVSNQMSMNI